MSKKRVMPVEFQEEVGIAYLEKNDESGRHTVGRACTECGGRSHLEMVKLPKSKKKKVLCKNCRESMGYSR